MRLETVVRAVCGYERPFSTFHQDLCWASSSFQMWKGHVIFLKWSWRFLLHVGLFFLQCFGHCCCALPPPAVFAAFRWWLRSLLSSNSCIRAEQELNGSSCNWHHPSFNPAPLSAPLAVENQPVADSTGPQKPNESFLKVVSFSSDSFV